MTTPNRRTGRPWALIVLGAGVFAAGAATMYVFVRSRDARLQQPGPAPAAPAPVAPAPVAQTESTASSGHPLPDVVVPVSAEAARRAGIEIAPVRSGSVATSLRMPGTVTPNEYHRVVVTPLVSGRISRVLVQLGDAVNRGATLAEVYSPDLADAQTRYLSMRAELDAHEQRLHRTQRLVEIGAASRQELEQVEAEHMRLTSEIEGARSRLRLLGMSAERVAALKSAADVSATVRVLAPMAGVITERAGNVGTSVDDASNLFTIAELSPVWVIGDVFEKDLARVRVGAPASVTTDAYPGLVLAGRVTYIAPQVRPETRTALVRAEVPNPQHQLRFGMYVQVTVQSLGGTPAVLVPRGAIQTVGARRFVYLAQAAGTGFIEREIRVGDTSDVQVPVLSGLKDGDVIVTAGSFYLRAERERLGLRPLEGSAGSVNPAPTPAGSSTEQQVQTATVTVARDGYHPSSLTLKRGVLARVTFTRTADETCGTDVVFPAQGIRRALPLNEPVVIEFTPKESGEVTFTCGMSMLKGLIVVH